MKFIICPLLARALPKRIVSFVAESTQEASAIFIIYLLDAIRAISDKDRKPDEPQFDASKYPMVVINFAGMVTTFVADPNIV